MPLIAVISIVAAIVWVILTALSYRHWKQVGERIDEPLELPSWIGILLLPVWTVRAWITVSWLPRRRLTKRIDELRDMEAQAKDSDADSAMIERLREHRAMLEGQLARRRKRR